MDRRGHGVTTWMTFKYGMPPHGGLGIGLERLTMQLLGEENVREDLPVPKRSEQTGTVKKGGRKMAEHKIIR